MRAHRCKALGVPSIMMYGAPFTAKRPFVESSNFAESPSEIHSFTTRRATVMESLPSLAIATEGVERFAGRRASI